MTVDTGAVAVTPRWLTMLWVWLPAVGALLLFGGAALLESGGGPVAWWWAGAAGEETVQLSVADDGVGLEATEHEPDALDPHRHGGHGDSSWKSPTTFTSWASPATVLAALSSRGGCGPTWC